MSELCPCCSELEYNNCCGKFLSKKEIPNTPEELMRSRYTAYTIADIDYVFDTMRDAALKDADRRESLKWAKTSKWNGLQILKSSIDDNNIEGEVEFIASFTQDNTNHDLKEYSKFKKYDNKWYYVGNIEEYSNYINKPKPVRVNKIGRNDPCTCGSGKKYKKCCYN